MSSVVNKIKIPSGLVRGTTAEADVISFVGTRLTDNLSLQVFQLGLSVSINRDINSHNIYTRTVSRIKIRACFKLKRSK